MYVMYDSTEPGQIPRSAGAVAGYVGGFWPDYGEEVKRWPHARHLSIAVNAGEDAECLDIENGDATPANAPGWFHRQRSRGVARPTFYASLSNVAAVEDVLTAAGITRHEYSVWAAHYTYIPHICGPSEGLRSWAQATQWTDHALGRNLDESLCVDSFFSTNTTAELSILLPQERSAVEGLVAYRKHPALHRHGIGVVHERVVHLRKAIWQAAEKGRDGHGRSTPRGWDIRNRRARYELLWRYSR